MKKKILMIGNTNGLHGVPVDFYAYRQFFTSPFGGNWYHEEIEVLPNPTRRDLFKKLDAIERANYDFIVTIFTGHGREERNDTLLGLNGDGERIKMRDLMGLSYRQLLILDCCRSCVPTPSETAIIEAAGTMMAMTYQNSFS